MGLVLPLSDNLGVVGVAIRAPSGRSGTGSACFTPFVGVFYSLAEFDGAHSLHLPPSGATFIRDIVQPVLTPAMMSEGFTFFFTEHGQSIDMVLVKRLNAGSPVVVSDDLC